MGKVWGADAVAKNQSTSLFGNIVSLDESTKAEHLLYVGTDDGLVQVTEDGGATWRKEEKFPGVPDMTYVSDLFASTHDANVVYAAFNNHKMGDFKPYLLRSADRGRTWTSIAGDLPARGSTWTFMEDPAERDLWFAGTEFGLFFSKDGGKKWVQLKGGMPTIAVRDMAIQKREGDLVVGTFGRGFYVLDDLTPLRVAKPADFEQAAMTFPVKKVGGLHALVDDRRSRQGVSRRVALHRAESSLRRRVHLLPEGRAEDARSSSASQARRRRRRRATANAYPTRDEFVAESREEAPAVVMTVTDAAGAVVRRITGPARAGLHRVAWNLRYPSSTPASNRPGARTTRSTSRRPDRWSCRGPTRCPSRCRPTARRRRSARRRPSR